MPSVKEDIRAGRFHNLYLLYGEEAFLRKSAVRDLLKALMPDGPSMNYVRYVGKEALVDEIIEGGNTLPFLEERRIILVEDSGFFKSAQDELVEYVKHLPEYLVLIFDEETIDKRGRLYKAASSVGLVEAYERLKEPKLAEWVAKYLEKNGKKIRGQDAYEMVARVGLDMNLMKGELDKLIAYTGSATVVERADIEAIVTRSLQDKIFDMLRLITSRRQEEALAIYADLLALKEAPVKIMILLGRQYSQLLRARELSGQGMSNQQLAAAIGVNPYAVKSLMQISSRYTSQELEEIIEEVVKTDEAIKTGRMGDRLATELLIVRLSASATRNEDGG